MVVGNCRETDVAFSVTCAASTQFLLTCLKNGLWYNDVKSMVQVESCLQLFKVVLKLATLFTFFPLSKAVAGSYIATM